MGREQGRLAAFEVEPVKVVVGVGVVAGDDQERPVRAPTRDGVVAGELSDELETGLVVEVGEAVNDDSEDVSVVELSLDAGDTELPDVEAVEERVLEGLSDEV